MHPVTHSFVTFVRSRTYVFFFPSRTRWSKSTRRCLRQRSPSTGLHASKDRRASACRRTTFGNISAAPRIARLRQQDTRPLLRDGVGPPWRHRWEQTQSRHPERSRENSRVQGQKSLYFRLGDSE